jgi:hypothetical protein
LLTFLLQKAVIVDDARSKQRSSSGSKQNPLEMLLSAMLSPSHHSKLKQDLDLD